VLLQQLSNQPSTRSSLAEAHTSPGCSFDIVKGLGAVLDSPNNFTLGHFLTSTDSQFSIVHGSPHSETDISDILMEKDLPPNSILAQGLLPRMAS